MIIYGIPFTVFSKKSAFYNLCVLQEHILTAAQVTLQVNMNDPDYLGTNTDIHFRKLNICIGTLYAMETTY